MDMFYLNGVLQNLTCIKLDPSKNRPEVSACEDLDRLLWRSSRCVKIDLSKISDDLIFLKFYTDTSFKWHFIEFNRCKSRPSFAFGRFGSDFLRFQSDSP